MLPLPITPAAYCSRCLSSNCLPLPLPIAPAAYRSRCLSLPLPIAPAAYRSLCLSLPLPIAPFAYRSRCLSLPLPIAPLPIAPAAQTPREHLNIPYYEVLGYPDISLYEQGCPGDIRTSHCMNGPWDIRPSHCTNQTFGQSETEIYIYIYRDVPRKPFVQCDVYMSPMSPGSCLNSEMSICPLCSREAVCSVRCLYVPYVPREAVCTLRCPDVPYVPRKPFVQ